MDTRKLILMSFFLTAFVLGHAASYAQENNNSVFISGRIGEGGTDRMCPGNCSADTRGAIGVGYNFFRMATDGQRSFSVSLEYTRQQLTINGNVLDVTVKGIALYPGFSFGKDDRFTAGVSFQWGEMTTGGPNIPERKQTGWGGRSGVDIFYRVGRHLDLMLGESVILVTTSTLPDIYSHTVDTGLRWHF